MGGIGGLDRVKRKLTRENARGTTETNWTELGSCPSWTFFSEKALGSFEDGVICQVSVIAVLRMDSGGPRKNTK